MTTRQKQSRVRRILRIEEQTRALYKKKDALTEELISAVPVGETITVEGKEFTVVDNFAAKNQVWSGACVRRFELSEKKPLPTRPKKPDTEAAAVESEVAA